MIRSLIVLLAGAIPVFAQSADDYKYRRQFASTRPLGGLVPRGVDESAIDGEALLRQLLPPEITLERQRPLLRYTVDSMQGVWRVESFMLDGTVLRPEEFAGLFYQIKGTVLVQRETSTEWLRPAPIPVTPSKLQTAVNEAQEERREPGSSDQVLRDTQEDQVEWRVPASIRYPVGATYRNDPKDEEGVRFNMLHRGPGQALVYSWDRYGESSDPYNLLNRPSARVVLPAIGALEVNGDQLVLAVRGIGLRNFLPSKFHGELGVQRSIFIRMARNDRAAPAINPAAASTGDLSIVLGLGNTSLQDLRPTTGAPADMGTSGYAVRPYRQVVLGDSRPEGKWIVRPMKRVELLPTPPDVIVRQSSPNAVSRPLVPKMRPVQLSNGG